MHEAFTGALLLASLFRFLSFSRKVPVGSFCSWAESTDATLEPGEAHSLAKRLVDGLYFKLVGGTDMTLQAVAKANDALLANPLRIQFVSQCFNDESLSLAMLVATAAARLRDSAMQEALNDVMIERNQLALLNEKLLSDDNLSREHQVFFTQAVLRGVLHEIELQPLAALVQSNPDHFTLKENLQPWVLEANEATVTDLVDWACQHVVAVITKCPSQLLAVWQALTTVLLRDKSDVVQEATKVVLTGAWNEGGSGPLSPSFGIPDFGSVLMASLFSDPSASGLSKNVASALVTRLKAPRAIMKEFLRGNLGTKLASLTPRRAAPATTTVTLGSVVGLVRLMVKNAATLTDLLAKVSLQSLGRGPVFDAVRLVDEAAQVQRAFERPAAPQPKPPVDKFATKRAMASVEHGGTMRVRQPRGRSISLPQIAVGDINSAVGDTLQPLDGTRVPWNDPVCPWCFRGCTLDTLNCKHCGQPVFTNRVGATVPRLIKYIAGMSYEQGLHIIQGDAKAVAVQNAGLRMQPSPYCGAHLFDMVHGNGLMLFITAPTGTDAAPTIMCIVPDDLVPGAVETIFVLSRAEGFIRYRRPHGSQSLPMQLIGKPLVRVADINAVSYFQNFVSQCIQTNYKFGLLYMMEGQTTEQELYTNCKESEQFQDFLKLIGRRVNMELHSGYSGGLHNNSGLLSVISKVHVSVSSGRLLPNYNEAEAEDPTRAASINIMWHVSTMLPITNDGEGHLHRKRHIGNDIVVVIFRDYGCTTEFVPVFGSQFNHVFIVVQPTALGKDGLPSAYAVQVTAKKGVSPSEPFVPCGSFYRPIERQNLHDFLLLKCINSEQGALFNRAFESRLKVVRDTFLKDFAQRFS
jgi:hypothetical protein